MEGYPRDNPEFDNLSIIPESQAEFYSYAKEIVNQINREEVDDTNRLDILKNLALFLNRTLRTYSNNRVMARAAIYYMARYTEEHHVRNEPVELAGDDAIRGYAEFEGEIFSYFVANLRDPNLNEVRLTLLANIQISDNRLNRVGEIINPCATVRVEDSDIYPVEIGDEFDSIASNASGILSVIKEQLSSYPNDATWMQIKTCVARLEILLEEKGDLSFNLLTLRAALSHLHDVVSIRHSDENLNRNLIDLISMVTRLPDSVNIKSKGYYARNSDDATGILSSDISRFNRVSPQIIILGDKKPVPVISFIDDKARQVMIPYTNVMHME